MQNIKHLADIEAERRHGINHFTELIAQTGDIMTFSVKLLPDYTRGYLSYDASQRRFI
jgi:hypothetical protein